ncbi:MAG: hypothetical protein JJE52_00410 [Acidimicrobiia bacterium]|nr:hypothetical protein [Acidimicrobiia bacterium]
MSPAQQPEVRRSGRTDLDPDHVGTAIEVEPHAPQGSPSRGPVPDDNQPGHHPDHEQDKPDLDAFAEKLGTKPSDERSTDAEDDERAATASGPEPRPDANEESSSLLGGAVSMAATMAHMAGKVVVPAFGAVRSLVGRLRNDDGDDRARRSVDADRIARLESRVADLERRLDQQS